MNAVAQQGSIPANSPALNYLKVTKNNESLKQNNGNSSSVKASVKLDIRVEIEIEKVGYSGKNINLQQKFQAQRELVDQTRAFLSTYFNENPEALQDIQNGKIPEYFNEENTARRILNIFFDGYNGEDRAAFADRAKSIISQAYGDVQTMVGGELPEIVLRTKDLIYEIIESFKNGEDKIFDFLGKDSTIQ